MTRNRIAITVALVTGMALALMAGISQAANAAIIVDRGLPTANLNNAAGSDRSNVAWDQNGPGFFVGDSANIGGPAGTQYRVDSIATWVVGGPANNDSDTTNDGYFLGNDFASVTLYTGVNTLSLTGTSTGNFAGAGSNATDNADISITRTQYNGGAGPEKDYQGSSGAYRTTFEVVFGNLNLLVSAGDTLWFGVDGFGTGNPFWFSAASNAALSGSPQDGSDNVMRCFNNSLTSIAALDCGAFDSNGNGWNKSSDINTRIAATVVPEPAFLYVLGLLLMIGTMLVTPARRYSRLRTRS